MHQNIQPTCIILLKRDLKKAGVRVEQHAGAAVHPLEGVRV